MAWVRSLAWELLHGHECGQKNNIYISPMVWLHHILFISSSVDGHLCCLHLLAIVNTAAVNLGLKISVRIPVFISSGYTPRSRIAESCGHSMFSFLRNLLESFKNSDYLTTIENEGVHMKSDFFSQLLLKKNQKVWLSWVHLLEMSGEHSL